MSAKVYAVHAGARISIDHYGTATTETACVVPDAVADQLEAEIAGLPAVPRDEKNPAEFPGWDARPGRTDIRVEREAAAAPAKAAKESKGAAAPAEEKK